MKPAPKLEQPRVITHSGSFFIIRKDYLEILGGDFNAAAVLYAIEYFSNPLWSQSFDPENWWLEFTSSRIIDFLGKSISRPTLYSCLDKLKELKIINIEANTGRKKSRCRIDLTALNSLIYQNQVSKTLQLEDPNCQKVDTYLSKTLQLEPSYPYCIKNKKRSNDDEAFVNKDSSFKEEIMSDTEIILKRFVDTPKKLKSTQYRNKSVSALYTQFGEKIEGLIDQHGFETVLRAMENFLNDQYWRERGLQPNAFLKQFDRYLEGETPEKHEPEAVPASLLGNTRSDCTTDTETPGAAIPGVVAEDDLAVRNRRITIRANEMLFLMSQVSQNAYEKARLALNLDPLDVKLVESWFSRAVLEYRSKFGVEPPVTTVPLD